MTVSNVLDGLGALAPWESAAQWDPVGLQFGDPSAGVDQVAVTHELTGAVAEQAIAEGVDLMVTYHPLIFRPLPFLRAGVGVGGRVLELIRRGIAVIAVHTNWDASAGGTADAMATALGLEDLRSFAPVDATDPTLRPEIGRIGRIPGGADLIDVTGMVDLVFTTRSRWSRTHGGRVDHVAVLPGSGGDFVPAAAAAGAEVLITGDVSHHTARAAQDLGLAVIDAGHAATERPGVAALYAAVSEIVGEARDMTTIDVSPWESA